MVIIIIVIKISSSGHKCHCGSNVMYENRHDHQHSIKSSQYFGNVLVQHHEWLHLNCKLEEVYLMVQHHEGLHLNCKLEEAYMP